MSQIYILKAGISGLSAGYYLRIRGGFRDIRKE